MKERRALVVRYDPAAPDADPTAELNALLADEWTVVSTSSMGGAALGPATSLEAPQFHFAALVVLEREEKRSVRGFGPA